MPEPDNGSLTRAELSGEPNDSHRSAEASDRRHGSESIDRLGRLRRQIRDRFGPVGSEPVLRALDWALAHSPERENEIARLGSLLLAQHADHASLAAMFLSRAASDAALGPLPNEFGDEISGLVLDLRSVSPASDHEDGLGVLDLRPLMDSMTRDVRSVLLRVAGCVFDLENAAQSTHERSDLRPMAREAFDVHAPLAERLGLYQLRRRLEDAAFRVLEPEVYRELSAAVAPIREQDEACVRILVDGVVRLLSRNGVTAEVVGRTKGLYSLYQKMLRKQCSVDQIMDRVGVRVIVDSVPTCYQVLGLLHAHFCPIPGTFHDYVGRPKENGYQSLHTCVHPLPGASAKPVEFQIRTQAMHTNAEFGAAAHWRYKNRCDADVIRSDQLRWLGDLSARCQVLDSPEFLEELRRQVYEEQIVVFQEEGGQLRLPAGSTVRDFLSRTLGWDRPDVVVHINGVHADDGAVLRDGDTVRASAARGRLS